MSAQRRLWLNLFYDTVTFQVEYVTYDFNEDERFFYSSTGYGEDYTPPNSTNTIKLSFGYLQSAAFSNNNLHAQPTLVCPIYVPDETTKNNIKNKIISVWFDGFPITFSRPIDFYSIYTNTIYAVWWPDFPFPGCSVENLNRLGSFLGSKIGNKVTMHIKITNEYP